LTGGGSGSVTLAVAAGGITNAMAATVPANSIKGNNTSAVAAPVDLTVAQTMTLLGAAPLASPVFTGTPTSTTPASTDNSLNIATTAYVKGQNYLTGNQAITLSGDISGTGATTITTTLPNVNSNVGTFQGLTINAKGQVTAAANQGYASLVSPIFTGVPVGPTAGAGTATTQLATTQFVSSAVAASVTSVTAGAGLTGGGTGAVTLAMANLPANTIIGNNAASTGAPVNMTVAQTMTLLAAAPLASPAFTGVPTTATTPALNDNTTKLATTAFVLGQASAVTPLAPSGSGTVGTSVSYARADHIHPAVNVPGS
jgi:hypothetical protein